MIKAVGPPKLAFQTSHENSASHLYHSAHSVPYTLLKLLLHSPFSSDRLSKTILTLLIRFDCRHGIYFCWFFPLGRFVWSSLLGWIIYIFVCYYFAFVSSVASEVALEKSQEAWKKRCSSMSSHKRTHFWQMFASYSWWRIQELSDYLQTTICHFHS